MKKTYEVEYRALLTPNIFLKLLKIGEEDYAPSFRGPITIKDKYFCPQKVKSFKKVEINKVGSYSLRIRTETKNCKNIFSINTKTITNHGDHNAWVENETNIDNPKEVERILEIIGFKCFFSIKKIRYSYKFKNISVFLEKIDDFGYIIEVEIITTEKQSIKAKSELLQFLDMFGVSKDKIVAKSVTNIIMKNKSVF